jgi:hypothetical protein
LNYFVITSGINFEISTVYHTHITHNKHIYIRTISIEEVLRVEAKDGGSDYLKAFWNSDHLILGGHCCLLSEMYRSNPFLWHPEYYISGFLSVTHTDFDAKEN